jgi:repressor LexA
MVMSESVNPTAEEIAAAYLRVVLDRRLGKSTAPIVNKIAEMAPDQIPRSRISQPETGSPFPSVREQHLVPHAVVAFVGDELSPGARERAAAHIARCSLCAAEVAIQRQTTAASGNVVGPAVENSPQAQDLTERERRALALIAHWLDRNGYPPSVREIGERIGLTSTSSVARVLRSLEGKGYLRRDPNLPRAVGIPVPDTDSPRGRVDQ